MGGSGRQSSYQWPPEVGEDVGLGTGVSVGTRVGVGRGDSVVDVGRGEVALCLVIERAATRAPVAMTAITASKTETENSTNLTNHNSNLNPTPQ